MKRIKTQDLTGPALDWAVAKCEGHTDGKDFAWYYDRRNTFNFSTNWAQGGPIIEREQILIQPEIGKEGCANAWNAISMQDTEDYGPTPLIAAMRCYVASKLGDEVEIPKEIAPCNT